LRTPHRLPIVYPYRFFVTSGGLISYGPDLVSQYRRAAGYPSFYIMDLREKVGAADRSGT
jgi:hypothetical protein